VIFSQGVYVSTNPFAVSSSIQDFDLSRNESFRTLQIVASCIGRMPNDGSPHPTSSFLSHTLSTITSPEFSNVVVVYRSFDFLGVESSEHPHRPPLRREISRTEEAQEVLWHRRLFEVLRGVHKVRDFKLELCADVWEPVGEYSVGILKQAVAEEKASGGFDGFSSEPFVTYYPRRTRL